VDTQNLLFIGSYMYQLSDLNSVRNALLGFIEERLGHSPSPKAARKLRAACLTARQGAPISAVLEACIKAGDAPTTRAVSSLVAVFDLQTNAEANVPPKAQPFLSDQLRRHAGDAQAIENIRTAAREVKDVLKTKCGLKPEGIWHSWNILQRAIWCIERCNSVPEAILVLSGDPVAEAAQSFSTVAELWQKWSPNADNIGHLPETLIERRRQS